ncbi:DUF2474 domain-containing protein [Pusillimonas sp. ANT_WB101]|nr:DUF2474 domain-containing protein [Pusillimonas sp. ANT_WB101]
MAITDPPDISQRPQSRPQQSKPAQCAQQDTQNVQFAAQQRITALSWWRRLGWLVLIWGASIVALAMVAGLLKLFMNAAGLTA